VETFLALAAAVVTGLYAWLMFYGSRQRWMRGGATAWRTAFVISLPFLVAFAAASVISNNLLFGIPTIFMFTSAFISIFEWDVARRYIQTWEPE
jgi:cellulose synthase/poly-beta-1,6-N-acetylglucosamine synthase-like glycosyltransferase